MGKIILSILLLVIVASWTDMKTGVGVEANTKPNLELWIQHNKQIINNYRKPVIRVVAPTKKVAPVKIVKPNKAELITYSVTAYTNGYESTQKRKGEKGYGITASGKRTVEGVTIAADTRVLPFGTVVYIEGLGERTVTDRGGAIKGHKIDVFFDDLEDAKKFGRKKLSVRIISKPKGQVKE